MCRINALCNCHLPGHQSGFLGGVNLEGCNAIGSMSDIPNFPPFGFPSTTTNIPVGTIDFAFDNETRAANRLIANRLRAKLDLLIDSLDGTVKEDLIKSRRIEALTRALANLGA